MKENIRNVEPWLKVFPPEEEVFAEPVARYARHLHPLVSIDLSVINPAWRDWIHVLLPIEPADDYIGETTSAFHNYFSRSNWIGFHLNAEGRYEFIGDFRYFFLENPPEDDFGAPYRKTLEAHYVRQQASFIEQKARFAEHGLLYSAACSVSEERDFSEEEPDNIINQLGGKAGYTNWVEISDFPVEIEGDEEFAWPVMPDGTRFHFIADVTGWHYRDAGPDSILLFFEPESRTAALTFDYC